MGRGFRFLGFDFKGKNKGISTKSLDKRKDTVRDITRCTQGVNLIAVIEKLNLVIRGHVPKTFGWAMYRQYIAN